MKYTHPHPFDWIPEWVEKDPNLPERFLGDGLTIYEDDHVVGIEAAMPGVSSQNLKTRFKNRILKLKGSRIAESETGRHYYSRAARSYSYELQVPGDIDLEATPEIICTDGLVKVFFRKRLETQSIQNNQKLTQ